MNIINLCTNKNNTDSCTSKKNKKIISFQICGIGNGHLTQAKTVYDTLINYAKIPVVLIYGRLEGYDQIFNYSRVIYFSLHTNEKSIEQMDKVSCLLDLFTPKYTTLLEKQYEISEWINFWMIDLFNTDTKQTIIADQFNCQNYDIDIIVNICKIFCNVSIYSIINPTRFSQEYLGSLINLNIINRNKIEKNLIVCYSVSGNDFIFTLGNISKNYPNFNFKLFINYHIEYSLPKNVNIYKIDSKFFKDNLERCQGVLCTSGNELIQECVYNNIPVATMPCNYKQYEQVHNFKKYCFDLEYSIQMNENLNLDELVNRNMEEFSLKFQNMVKNRDSKIIELIK